MVVEHHWKYEGNTVIGVFPDIETAVEKMQEELRRRGFAWYSDEIYATEYEIGKYEGVVKKYTLSIGKDKGEWFVRVF